MATTATAAAKQGRGGAGRGSGSGGGLSAPAGFRERREGPAVFITDDSPAKWVERLGEGASLSREGFVVFKGEGKFEFRLGPIHVGHLNFGYEPEGLEGKETFVAWTPDGRVTMFGCGEFKQIAEAVVRLAKEAGVPAVNVIFDCSQRGYEPGRYHSGKKTKGPFIDLQDSENNGCHDFLVERSASGTSVKLIAPPAYPQLATGGERMRL